ncbi:hypothetical protein CN327_10160 [Bacillus cereus]|nr:hypothetical protein CN509_16580 [Bacillus cereus]PET08185.1 hypothetical protein CN505_06480 [Bacillus cereus]PFF34532.1 hypothetical protein CN327_10160 [Bacillus cereus]PFI48357.1 hypothetical protein COI73_12665 [Bacillus cereus]
MRKGWFLLIVILILLSGCGEKQQIEESKPKEQSVSSSEEKQSEENKSKEQAESNDVKQNTEESKPKEQTESGGVKQSTTESEPKSQTESSGKKSDDDNQVKIGDNGEIIIDFEIEKGTNKVHWFIPPADVNLQLSVGQKVKLHHKNMDPELPLKILVSGDTLSIDEVPHEGRVAINVEEYTVRAIKKGNGTITIAPNADLQLADKMGVDVK